MRERIIEAIFDFWTDSDFKTRDRETIDNCIQEIAKKFNHIDEKSQIFIETQIMEAICSCEKNAFKEGFALCIELFNGSLMGEKEHMEECCV